MHNMVTIATNTLECLCSYLIPDNHQELRLSNDCLCAEYADDIIYGILQLPLSQRQTVRLSH